MSPRKKESPSTPLTGFAVGKNTGRTKKYVCDLEGFEGFEIEVKRLTFADINEIPLKGTHTEIWEVISPFVVSWNAQAETESGSWDHVPPPAEAGPDAFKIIEPELSTWIWAQLKFGHLGGADLQKKPSESGSSPEKVDGSS